MSSQEAETLSLKSQQRSGYREGDGSFTRKISRLGSVKMKGDVSKKQPAKQTYLLSKAALTVTTQNTKQLKTQGFRWKKTQEKRLWLLQAYKSLP